MTREIFTPSPLYTIATAGPYPITHPYQVDTEIACTVFQGTTIVDLVNGVDFTVAPSSSETTGDVTLSAAVFATYTGGSLLIRRKSVADQGWAGQTAREKGLEAQLDALTQRLQEIDEAVDRAIKLPEDTAPELPLDTTGLFLGFDASNVLYAGTPLTTTSIISPFAASLLDDPDATAARRTLEIGGTGPLVLVIMGQSNAQGANNGGPNPASSLVKAWDAVAGDWGSSDYTQAPWTHSNPDGNSANNNIALARAHRLADDTGREVFIIYSAYGGTSIDAWVGSGTSSYAWVDIEAKIAAAFATPELAGKTTVDEIIWAQGEADYLDTFAEHLANLKLLRRQYRNASWCDWETPIYMTAPSNQHEAYAPEKAIEYLCSKVDTMCILVPSNGLRTHYDPQGDGSVIVSGQDYTHFLGESLWELGYTRIGLARPFEAEPPLFYTPGTGSPDPSAQIVIATFDSITNWSSRTGGGGFKETFSGDGVTTAFTLKSRNPIITKLEVGGVALVDGVDFTLSGQVITFTAAPAVGASNIDAFLSVTVQTAPAFGSISWGLFCYADGNYTQCYGYDVYTDNLSSFGALVGHTLRTENGADYFLGSGWQNVIAAGGSFVAGRGNTVADEYQATIGTFAEYAAAEVDPVRFQVGIGTTTSSRKNALTVRASGAIEAKNLLTFSTNAASVTGGLAVGTIYQTATGELRIVV